MRPVDTIRLLAALALLLAAMSATTQSAYGRSRALDGGSKTDWTDRIEDVAGGKIVAHRIRHFGTVVEMSGSEAKRLHLSATLNMHGGTVSFWIRPEWKEDSIESHTLLSGRWDDTRRSYFVISQGWWEPNGSGRLYFVASNEDVVHCSAARQLPPLAWSLITVTWASGEHGFCKLYVDDELLAETQRPWSGGTTIATLALGSDEYASNSRGRTARAGLGALEILDHPITHHEVIDRYRSEEDPSAIYLKKWAWLDGAAENSAPGAGGDTHEARQFEKVLFDEDMTWATSPAVIDERLRRIKKAGFTIYTPCVWHGRGTTFRSRLAPFDSRLSGHAPTGWDPLAYLIAQAHIKRIAVHAWFTVVRREDDAHPEWAAEGTPEGAFDVHQAGFRDFAAGLMLDVVSRYEVDGLNLDYIRAMGVCRSAFCQADYRRRTSADLLSDYSNGSADISARHRIQAWQDDAVGSLVQRLSAEARKIKPQIAISVDGYAVGDEEQRPLEGRNEIVWANREWVDAVYHMDYRSVVDTRALSAARALMKDPRRLRLLIANYELIDDIPVPRSGTWMSRVVRYARDVRRDSGVGVYLYSRLNDEQIRALR